MIMIYDMPSFLHLYALFQTHRFSYSPCFSLSEPSMSKSFYVTTWAIHRDPIPTGHFYLFTVMAVQELERRNRSFGTFAAETSPVHSHTVELHLHCICCICPSLQHYFRYGSATRPFFYSHIHYLDFLCPHEVP